MIFTLKNYECLGPPGEKLRLLGASVQSGRRDIIYRQFCILQSMPIKMRIGS